jgi:hypothetical protein
MQEQVIYQRYLATAIKQNNFYDDPQKDPLLKAYKT